MPEADLPKSVSPARPNPNNNTTMFQIFQNVQYNVVQHKKYVKEMIKLYKKLDENAFRESFKNALHYLFTFGDMSANVDRVIHFVATFCTSLDDEEEFLLFIVGVIFDCQCVSGQSVRYRASQLLAAVLSALGEDASLDDDLCDKLLSSQMDRLQDTRGAVRCRAALALQRLQNPMDTDDGVTRAYRFHMSCDPSSSVRRAIVMSIAKCIRNVPFVLERLCDVDEAVRRAAFLYVSAINVTQLRVRQRVLILKVGLTERSQRVRRVVEEILIPGWLSTFKGNIIDLLNAIRLDNAKDAKDSQYVAKKLLESLFKRLAISELLEWLPTDKTLRLIPAEKLNKETAWYWRHLAEHLQKIEDDETLEAVLPDLVVFTGYIRAIVESPCPSENEDPVGFSTRQYVLDELGSMLRVYDASDPTGRTALQSLITDVLTGDYGPLSPEVIRAFVSALELAVPEVAQRVELIYGAISALRDPPEPELQSPPPPQVDSIEVKMQKAKLRVSLNVAMEAQEEAVREQNYALAAECKAKVEDIQKQLEEMNLQSAPQPPPPPPMHIIQEKKSDPDTLNKCLIILNSALDTPQLKSITPMLHIIFNELEVEIKQNADILENALQTLALYAMLDKEFVKEHKAFLFAILIDQPDERAVTTVLQCIVDILCVHGARVFDEDSTESQQDLIESKSKRNTYHSVDALDADGTLSQSALLMTPSHSTVIEILLRILDSTCASYRLIIVEGLCRLLYLGHIESPSIISRLLLLWFNPVTVEEDMVRQTIGVFFQTFPTSVDSAQEQIQKAIIPTLRVLANAPSNSPLAEIDQEAVVRFLVSLSRINHDETDNQGATATLLCSHLVRRPDAGEAALACRMLALLAPPRDARAAAVLANMLRDLCLKLPDKQSCRNLTRYLGALEATERASLNKMSNTGVSEGTMQAEDTLSQLGRATSLPQPIARSTHVVIDETVEEEVEINEDSPNDPVPAIAKEQPQSSNNSSPKSGRQSSDSKSSSDTSRPEENSSENADDNDSIADSDTIGVSPVKKIKISKEKKKKLSLNRQNNKGKSVQSKDKRTDKKQKGQKETIVKKDKVQEEQEKGVKRSRSQRCVEDINRVASKPTTRPNTRASAGSKDDSDPSSQSLFDDSADETELHTIVYNKELEQSLLNDSNESINSSKRVSKGSVTIPETPDCSDESESQSEPEIRKKNGKCKGKKK